MAFDQDLTCLIFPFRWASFLIELVEMLSGALFLSLKVHFR